MPRLTAILAALIVAGTLAAQPPGFPAKVVGVADGDTLTVLRDREQIRIRLNGIDSPETGQDFGSRAKAFTSAAAFGQVVTIEPLERDKYGRTVANVHLADGRMLNRELVREGLAWWYRKYAPADTELEHLEAEARAARRGLWAQPNPVAPWDWRHAQRPTLPAELAGKFIGNRRSRIYHKPGCPNAAAMSEANRQPFDSAAEAERQGFRAGRDCQPPSSER